MGPGAKGSVIITKSAVLCAVVTFGLCSSTEAAKNRITGISTTCAEAGSPVTLTGKGLKPGKVQVAVGDSLAEIKFIDKKSLTFALPMDAAGGSNVVRLLTIKGREKGRVLFQVGQCTGSEPVGFLLPGKAKAPALGATFDLPAVPVVAGQIADGLILSRLDVHLAPGATVGQINAALQLVNGRIVTMLRDFPGMTIAIPPQPDAEALQIVADILNAAPGISLASLAYEPTPDVLPPDAGGDPGLEQLLAFLPTRFPAAWNAASLATNDCASRKVIVLVPDHFRVPRTDGYTNFTPAEIPFFTLDNPATNTNAVTHGYDVITTMAGRFDGKNPTGANPFPECLDILAVQVAGISLEQSMINQRLSFPVTGKFIYSSSLGRAFTCISTNCANTINKLHVLGLGFSTSDWKAMTASRWDDFFAAQAAGNERGDFLTMVYPGNGVSRFTGQVGAATFPDPSLGFVSDTNLWDATVDGFPSLTVTNNNLTIFAAYLRVRGTDMLGPEDNVLIVGSTFNGLKFDDLGESVFSDSDPDVKAVGENVFMLDGTFQNGTSFAAPQVAGLASYLWLLSPELRNNRPSQITRRAILENARDAALTTGIIDAYATILSLDQAVLPTPASAPVRLAILDVMFDDNKFDETDLEAFVAAFTNSMAGTKMDYSRHDLNGDGFTGGMSTERFDLDRQGSTQFGATLYTIVTQTIEAQTVAFSEKALTDLQILCYCAYSDLYTGTAANREALLTGLCGGIQVSVLPAQATLAPTATQQFAATVTDTSDPRVTWTLPSGGGTIDTNGLFTAGTTAGAFPVRATSVADITQFGEAQVTIVVSNSPLRIKFAETTAGFITTNEDFSIPPTLPFQRSLSSDGNSIDYTMDVTGNNITFDVSATTVEFRGVRVLISAVFDVTVPTTVTVTVNPNWETCGGPGSGVLITADAAGADAAYGINCPNEIPGLITQASTDVPGPSTVNMSIDMGVSGTAGGNGNAVTFNFSPTP